MLDGIECRKAINYFGFKANSKFGGIDILVSNAAANPTVASVLDVKRLWFTCRLLLVMY